jgi:hypothetical protein
VKLSDEISEMTIALESGDNSPTRQQVYLMLMRALVEIRMLENQIRTLKGKLE